ncbi:MAG: hypothetical protein AB7G06_06650 [Bdellovibrionales bacterium]
MTTQDQTIDADFEITGAEQPRPSAIRGVAKAARRVVGNLAGAVGDALKPIPEIDEAVYAGKVNLDDRAQVSSWLEKKVVAEYKKATGANHLITVATLGGMLGAAYMDINAGLPVMSQVASGLQGWAGIDPDAPVEGSLAGDLLGLNLSTNAQTSAVTLSLVATSLALLPYAVKGTPAPVKYSLSGIAASIIVASAFMAAHNGALESLGFGTEFQSALESGDYDYISRALSQLSPADIRAMGESGQEYTLAKALVEQAQAAADANAANIEEATRGMPGFLGASRAGPANDYLERIYPDLIAARPELAEALTAAKSQLNEASAALGMALKDSPAYQRAEGEYIAAHVTVALLSLLGGTVCANLLGKNLANKQIMAAARTNAMAYAETRIKEMLAGAEAQVDDSVISDAAAKAGESIYLTFVRGMQDEAKKAYAGAAGDLAERRIEATRQSIEAGIRERAAAAEAAIAKSLAEKAASEAATLRASSDAQNAAALAAADANERIAESSQRAAEANLAAARADAEALDIIAQTGEDTLAVHQIITLRAQTELAAKYMNGEETPDPELAAQIAGALAGSNAMQITDGQADALQKVLTTADNVAKHLISIELARTPDVANDSDAAEPNAQTDGTAATGKLPAAREAELRMQALNLALAHCCGSNPDVRVAVEAVMATMQGAKPKGADVANDEAELTPGDRSVAVQGPQSGTGIAQLDAA